jgi:hypothetical protein
MKTLALALVVLAAAALAPFAAADGVYSTEHLALTPAGDAPLRSGFVQNIKANGPEVYAHEIFVLNGAKPNTTYTVTRRFFGFDPKCTGGEGTDEMATMTTNAAGNAKADAFVRPEQVPAAYRGKHGVLWTVADASKAIQYSTTCTEVTLD